MSRPKKPTVQSSALPTFLYPEASSFKQRKPIIGQHRSFALSTNPGGGKLKESRSHYIGKPAPAKKPISLLPLRKPVVGIAAVEDGGGVSGRVGEDDGIFTTEALEMDSGQPFWSAGYGDA